MTLTKDHLVSALAEANGYPRNKAVELVETLIETNQIQTRGRRGCPNQRIRQVLHQEKAGEARQKSGNRRGYDA